MTNASRVCAECGATVFADAPQGFCSVCLFRTGLASEDDEAFEPTVARMLKDFGDHELLEEIGRGGQGVVYRARQKSLNRIVALKVIGLAHWATEAHVKRFRMEAEAAAHLDDPRIVSIYEIGERDGACYFSMKFIEGGQLDKVVGDELMSLRKAAELVAKLARTLDYAHHHGVLHRDVKPGNILLDAKDEPHLTDFGLARLVETESTVTRTLEVLGTPSYMAPEQAQGQNEQLTRATDVYGLGAVFYQLLTGHPPFAGGTTYETVRLVLETEPRQPRLWNPKIDRDLSTICLKCLEKDPQCRYSSALALAEDLERWLRHEPIQARHTGVFTRGEKWLRRNPTTALLFVLSLAFAATVGVMIWKSRPVRPPSSGVAVLPFVNLSAEKENEYLSDGITEDLCTALSQIKGLRVPARTSSFVFKGKTADIRKIGKQLNVSTVLEGSVSKAGNKVRISAQLNNVADGFHLWAATYDRDVIDILEIRSDISRKVADALKVQLGVKETQLLAKKPTENSEAYEIYLLGRFEFNKFSEAGFNKAVEHFKHAIAVDPSFALAYAGLAEAYSMLGYWNYVPPKESFPEAKQAALQALKLDPALDEAHIALAFVLYEYEWLFEQADHEFREAIRLNPDSATARMWFGEFLFLMARYPEADQELESARKLDPLSLRISFDLAVKFFFMRQFDLAANQLQRTLSMDPGNSLCYYLLGQILWKMNKPTEAFNSFQKSLTLEGVLSEEEIGELRKAYGALGLSGYKRKESELMEKQLAQGKYQSAHMIAHCYATAGADNRKALDWLERAVEERSPWLPELKVDPTWDDLRSQPHFIEVLKKVGLEK